MDRWVGRVALVTGASSGIGRAIASRLVEHGLIVVACARRLELLQELKSTHANGKGRIIPIKCDLRKEEEILSMFQRIKEEVGGVDICVNNAGTAKFAPLIDGSTELWREMLELNILATCICTRETIKSLKDRGLDDGFIINIGSIYGQTYNWASGFSFYGMTKHAVGAMSKGHDAELRKLKSGINVAEICPGFVTTEILAQIYGQSISDKIYTAHEALPADDIADCTVFCLSAPPKAKVSKIVYDTLEVFDFTDILKTHHGPTQSHTA